MVDVAAVTVPVETEREPSTGRILIVDDNQDSADVMAMLMAKANYGYEVRTAYRVFATCNDFFRAGFCLLDLSTPEPDGRELARRFQQMTEPKKLC